MIRSRWPSGNSLAEKKNLAVVLEAKKPYKFVLQNPLKCSAQTQIPDAFEEVCVHARMCVCDRKGGRDKSRSIN